MNHIFRVVFNHITGTWVAVSELAKAHGKKASVSVVLPHLVDNHSKLFAHRSGSLNGLMRIAPLCLAIAGVFGTSDALAVDDYKCEKVTVSGGYYAYRCGLDNTAIGLYSSAVGYSNTASGVGSSAVGYRNTASADYASAVGGSNEASGVDSSAVG